MSHGQRIDALDFSPTKVVSLWGPRPACVVRFRRKYTASSSIPASCLQTSSLAPLAQQSEVSKVTLKKLAQVSHRTRRNACSATAQQDSRCPHHTLHSRQTSRGQAGSVTRCPQPRAEQAQVCCCAVGLFAERQSPGKHSHALSPGTLRWVCTRNDKYILKMIHVDFPPCTKSLCFISTVGCEGKQLADHLTAIYFYTVWLFANRKTSSSNLQCK